MCESLMVVEVAILLAIRKYTTYIYIAIGSSILIVLCRGGGHRAIYIYGDTAN